jgi:HTH-type transcriptional regulator/antitoxin HigA
VKGKYPFTPDYCVPPGATLAEWLADAGKSPLAFARAQGWSLTFMRLLLTGEAILSPWIASVLADATGIPAAFWLASERGYREGLAAGKVSA